jgi:Mor family transcriptional regulator
MSDDIIRRLIECLRQAQPCISEATALSIERQLRYEFAGERVYIMKRRVPRCEIVQSFNGHNAGKVARELGVSKSTIYRATQDQRLRKKRS